MAFLIQPKEKETGWSLLDPLQDHRCTLRCLAPLQGGVTLVPCLAHSFLPPTEERPESSAHSPPTHTHTDGREGQVPHCSRGGSGFHFLLSGHVLSLKPMGLVSCDLLEEFIILPEGSHGGLSLQAPIPPRGFSLTSRFVSE